MSLNSAKPALLISSSEMQRDNRKAYVSPVPGQHSRSQTYMLNECLGSEDRCQEFKVGPTFMGDLRINIAKYLCGFVNSNVDGRILIGVEDDGSVRGYSLCQRERDRCTLQIDEAVKEIVPKIFTESYSVTFTGVVDEDGYFMRELYVIEVSIKGKSLPHDQLYSCNKGAFMRRDGGLQNLSPQEIQQWVRQHGLQEATSMKQELNNVKNQNKQKVQNLEKQLQKAREDNTQYQDKIREHMTELEVLKSEMNYRSKMEQEQSVKDEENKVSNQELKQEIGQLRDLIEKSSHRKSKVCAVM